MSRSRPPSRSRARAGRGVFDHGAVRIETLDGEVLESRERPRERFFGLSGLRRNLRWDALDATYFAGYAWWNYLNAPYLLAPRGRQRARGRAVARARRGETWRRLEARFRRRSRHPLAAPDVLLRRRLRLRRHDYTAEVVGRWARAAHLCARPRRGRRAGLPDAPLGAAARPGNAPLARADARISATLRDRGRAGMSEQARSSGTSPSRTTARRLAGRSPTRASSTSAARRCPGAHMAVALWLTRGAAEHVPGAAPRRSQLRRLDRDHRGARPAPAAAAALPRGSRRAAAGARARGLLRREARARRSGCSPGTSCAPTASGWSS